MTQEAEMQDFLSHATTHLLRGGDLRHAIGAYDVPHDEAMGYARLISRLDTAYQPVRMSARFQRDLKADLLGTPLERAWVARVRYLPARVHLAAMVAVVGGFLLLLQRLLLPNSRTDNNHAEMAA